MWCDAGAHGGVQVRSTVGASRGCSSGGGSQHACAKRKSEFAQRDCFESPGAPAMILNKRGGIARSRSSLPPSQHCVGRVEVNRSHPQWTQTLTCSNTLIGCRFSLAEKVVVFWPTHAGGQAARGAGDECASWRLRATRCVCVCAHGRRMWRTCTRMWHTDARTRQLDVLLELGLRWRRHSGVRPVRGIDDAPPVQRGGGEDGHLAHERRGTRTSWHPIEIARARRPARLNFAGQLISAALVLPAAPVHGAL